jgi:N-acetylglutamate synthase-like GNAT family acetyltransferase
MRDDETIAITIRRATADDQPTIRRMVRQSGLDPTNLRWPNFVVAEYIGAVVGIGQVRPYRKGRELGSLVVREDLRRRGIGQRIVERLLEAETGSVYLECAAHMTPYYERFGFREVRRRDVPGPLRVKSAVGNVFARLIGTRLAVMKRDGEQREG